MTTKTAPLLNKCEKSNHPHVGDSYTRALNCWGHWDTNRVWRIWKAENATFNSVGSGLTASWPQESRTNSRFTESRAIRWRDARESLEVKGKQTRWAGVSRGWTWDLASNLSSPNPRSEFKFPKESLTGLIQGRGHPPWPCATWDWLSSSLLQNSERENFQRIDTNMSLVAPQYLCAWEWQAQLEHKYRRLNQYSWLVFTTVPWSRHTHWPFFFF